MVQDPSLADLVERAATHQMRALAYIRQARIPAAQDRPAWRPRELTLRALEQIATSQRLLCRAQALDTDAEQAAFLTAHLAQLAAVAAQLEQAIHRRDEAALQ